MKIIPMHDNVLLKLNPVQQRKVGEVWIASKHSEKIRVAEVLEIGEEVTTFKKGDKVLVNFYAGVVVYLLDLNWLDDTHRVFAENEIFAKIEE